MEKDWADDLWLKVEKTEKKKKHDIWSDVAAKARNNHLYSSQAYGFVGKWGTPFHPLVSNYGAFSAWNAVVFLQKRHKIARPSTASGTSVAPPPSLLLSCRLYLVHLLAYVTLNQTWLAAGGNSLFPELNGYLNRKTIYTSRRMSGDGRMSLSYFLVVYPHNILFGVIKHMILSAIKAPSSSAISYAIYQQVRASV
jgi:hypothetical protein